MMRVDRSASQSGVRSAPGRAPMYVEGAQRLPPPLTPDFVSSPPRPPLAAMLDQADADDASLLTRLCALTAFTRATDEAFADPPSADLPPPPPPARRGRGPTPPPRPPPCGRRPRRALSRARGKTPVHREVGRAPQQDTRRA